MQEVFEKIIEKLEEYKYENLVEHDSEVSQHCKDVGDCDGMDCSLCVFDKAIVIVKQAAAEYDGGWIPCSERLPIEEKYRKRIDGIWCYRHLLVSTNETDVPIQIGWYDQEDETWHDIEGFVFYPAAWQPLPEPYQQKMDRINCKNRHENGNCLVVGGFCTAVQDKHCQYQPKGEA